MIKIFVLLLCLLAISDAKPKKRIHHGLRVSSMSVRGAYSFVVSMIIFKSKGYRVCTGSLINPNTVVTAASCLCDAKRVEVFYKTTMMGHGSRVLSQSFEKDSRFKCGDDTAFQSHVDIGKVNLAESIPDIKPIRLYCKMPTVGEEPVRILGYGRDETGRAGHLRIGKYMLMNCPSSAEGAICIGKSPTGKIDTDRGDLGAPIFMNIRGDLVLVGVVSGPSGTSEDPVYAFSPVASACKMLQN